MWPSPSFIPASHLVLHMIKKKSHLLSNICFLPKLLSFSNVILTSLLTVGFFFFFVFLGGPHGIWGFPGWGANQSYGC